MLRINHALSVTAVCEIESVMKIDCKHPFTEPPATVKETRHKSVLEVVRQPSYSGCLPWCWFGSGHILDPDVALFGSIAIAALVLFTSIGLIVGTRVTLHCKWPLMQSSRGRFI